MKILQVITSLQIGGAEKLISEIVPMLRDKGNEVDVLAFDGVETYIKSALEEKGIKVLSFGINCNVYNPLFIVKLAKLMKTYDVVHTHNTAPQIFAAIGSYFSKCKLVTTEHSTSNRRRNHWYFKYIDRWLYRRYKKIICISEPSEENLRAYIGNNYPILTIKNGVNISNITNAAAIDLGIGDCKKITMVAGFRYEKDQTTVIKALKYLPEDFHVVLVGDGEKRLELETLISAEGLQDRVHLLGIRKDVPNILRSSDYIVMSSHREGLSLSNVEGMSAGHPFIASDVEGLREVTKGYGLLFPHGDSKALADIILKLSSDTAYTQSVAAKCWERAQMFDIQKMVDAYNDLYLYLV